MDYKYINQLLELYWSCKTTLEEEEILRTFFSQIDIPEEFEKYRPLFLYEQVERKTNVLGNDFDEKILSMIDEPIPVKARTVSFTQRLMPLFRAAAIVAIILTLGNAAQVAFNSGTDDYNYNTAGIEQMQQGTAVAFSKDSTTVDSMKQSNLQGLTNEAIVPSTKN
ncbi:MAG: pyruvate ferredoxin oxidoreductase [Prevotella sp.]|nr:pyruvate ferredoxin oxidoreductase [Prevotella sp.]